MFDIKKTLPAMFLTLLFTGCEINSYLDKAESGGMQVDIVFSTYQNANGFLSAMYEDLFHDEWMPVYGFSYGNVTDEGYCPYPQNTAIQTFTNGSLSPSNNELDMWARLYALIRKTHIFLENIDLTPAETNQQADDLARMKGEAFFIRAWCYAELFKRYGGAPLIDRRLEITDDFNIPRNTAEEVVNFIAADCDEAAEILPPAYQQSNMGRATRGAAMMLRARTLLYFASPLHNPSNDQGRWQRAADAHRDVMELNIYGLHNEYVGLFHTRYSDEIIFQSTVNFNANGGGWNDWQQQNTIQREWGWANNQPTQNMVDAYEMKNGLLIDAAGSGYDPQRPYENRDPRLDYTIYRNGSIWKRRTNEPPIETFTGGLDGIYNGPDGGPQKYSYTQTGYYLGDKMLDPDGHLQPWPGNVGSNYWIFMRYAETLLSYAEAQNEANATPDQSVYDAVNRVRQRPDVNMPPLPPGLSKEEMRERIRRERMVELAFENHRFWDVKRWRIGEEVFKDIYGMRITKETDGSLTHEPFLLETRAYKPAFDLFPIPQSEMNRNKALEPNPGY